ncbi:adaptin N terminal region-domain-containing protein [Lentinula aff. lateritia]|uniref:Adaptin N terminal region-domain-containing protein n=1 Tax=Lentinula aff. lateritia TaxID=2804960 RepID=A0ACC1UBI8_9AGAR|nr:adaptin N terminal region-domain-containing protein [Lentinula aff. lateritia]
MWERTLQDLIRGLRANKADESKFIAKAIEEIRQEIKSDDMVLKSGAVLKLTYLDMMGYDMSWASFHVVEVMSSPKLHLKSVGYLGAIQSFDQDTDVLMLTTNLLKKDLTSSPADIALTLNGISHILTPDLARDLSPELIQMLTHSRPAIRKRAVLALYKLVKRYPEVSTQVVSRLKDKLEDPDAGVIAATVNVLCELTLHNPKDYLALAPPLFHLMTTSSNNWMLIKIIKLFGTLSPYEPRLVKKLQPPITELISTTPAISLLYECVHTCIIGGMLEGSSGDALARTCVSKLAAFIQDSDQNLKYIALLAMVKIVPTHPHLVAQYQDTILASVNDQDISIRMRALDLVSAMVDETNLQNIVQQVLSHLVTDTPTSDFPSAAESLAQHTTPSTPLTAKPSLSSPSASPAYRLTLAQRILQMCSQNTYENVTNFEWYLSVLVDLAHVANVDVGVQIRDQMVDVVGRVKAARRYAVKLMFTLLSDDAMLQNAQDEGSCSEVLWAAAFICGEYCSELTDPQKLLPLILQPGISNLSPDIVAVYIQAATKIFGFYAAEVAQRWIDDDLHEVKAVVQMVIERVGPFVSSSHIEVQERAANTLQLFNFILADLNSYRPRSTGNPFDESSSSYANSDVISEPRFPKSLFIIQPLFSSYELNPVAQHAQESVPIPEGLDLDAWIVPPPADPLSPLERGEKKAKRKIKREKGKDGVSGSSNKGKKKQREENGQDHGYNGNGLVTLIPLESETETEEQRTERERRRAERLERQRDDPYYIMDKKPSKTVSPPHDVDLDSIPVVKLEGMPAFLGPVDSRLPNLRSTPFQYSPEPFYIDRVGEMPTGAAALTNSSPSSHHSTPTPGSRPGSIISRTASPAPVRLSSGLTASISSFPQYEVADEDGQPATPTPEPVRVQSKKKKAPGTVTGKKKRPKAVAAS